MKIDVLSIQSAQNQTVIDGRNKYEAELNLRTSILGQQKEFTEKFVLPSVLATKVDSVFKEIKEYLDNLNTAEHINIFLDSYCEGSHFSVDIYNSGQKIDKVSIDCMGLEINNSAAAASRLVWKSMSVIKKAVGWNESSDQLLIIEIDGAAVEGSLLGEMFKNIESKNISVKITTAAKQRGR
ncbi:hypothetical protein AWW71_04805 [Bacillus cereus]|uniref:hypothetical protein n=1 Tax=Bacillus cereus group TaxID=86661 RepID=UPI0007622E19|nr:MULTISPECIES: hypothetical protein [Bacillus cereus group]KWU68421.1 hypothetical protein AWW71_04805 [Bacillus cereus]KWW50439.1 hypothetical protein AWW69_01790 [Bacillus cereus]MED3380638.1 hypothetical protein [Bacillus tropicus]